MKHPSWKSEILGLFEVLKSDSWIVFLFPMFFSSNWFYAYHFNDVNGAKFNIRTRSLNSVLYYISQIIGAYVFGYALDLQSVRRSVKAKAVWIVLFVLTMVIWGGGYAWQRSYTRAQTSQETYIKDDWTTSGYVGPMFLYMFYGFYDGKLNSLLPRAHSSAKNSISSVASDSLLVHGSDDKQWPEARQLRRLLQRHPVSRLGSRLSS